MGYALVWFKRDLRWHDHAALAQASQSGPIRCIYVIEPELWLHWRPVGEWLATQFLDYEPGIHWSQLQMQSGTTGINTTRVYNPIKQAQDHDPHGRFSCRTAIGF